MSTPTSPGTLSAGKAEGNKILCARCWRGLGLLVVGLFGFSCVSATPRPPEVFEECQETLRRGVFHTASLACLPELAGPLEDLLCSTTFATHRDLNNLGFGYGTSILGQKLGEEYGVDPRLAQHWRHQHCAGDPARSVQEIADLRDQAFSMLPAALVGPWQSCRDFLQDTSDFRCLVLGSFDVTGEDGTVALVATYSPWTILDFGARLKKDLQVQGATCGDERWRKGARIPSFGWKVLRCQRQGRSAVSFRLVTGKGECEGHLPELTEVPWQGYCAGS